MIVAMQETATEEQIDDVIEAMTEAGVGVHRTTVANAYAELESEGLIQGHVGRGTFIQGNGNGLKLSPPPPPMLGNGNGNGLRWELLFADERGDEILSRLTASAPDDALSFVMARPAVDHFPIEELQICVNAVLRREATDVLNLGSPIGYSLQTRYTKAGIPLAEALARNPDPALSPEPRLLCKCRRQDFRSLDD